MYGILQDIFKYKFERFYFLKLNSANPIFLRLNSEELIFFYLLKKKLFDLLAEERHF